MIGFTYPILGDYKRKQMMDHAVQLLQAQHEIQQAGGLHAFMLQHDEAEQFIANRHYPKGDRIDKLSGGQYFYHCHRENFETEEHGHIHCFIRKSGWPKSWKLADIPERDKYLNSPMTHLVAVGVNRVGQPVRLFMVNRWVSKECWFEAQKMQRLIPKFRLSITKDPHWQVVDGWAEHLVQLFAPQIAWLHERRDAVMAERMAANPGGDPYHDRAYEELASLPVSLEEQVSWLMQPGAAPQIKSSSAAR